MAIKFKIHQNFIENMEQKDSRTIIKEKKILAEKTGISLKRLSRIINETVTNITIEEVHKIAKALNKDIEAMYEIS